MRALGLVAENPNSNPNTANSLSELLHTVYLAWLGDKSVNGLNNYNNESTKVLNPRRSHPQISHCFNTCRHL